MFLEAHYRHLAYFSGRLFRSIRHSQSPFMVSKNIAFFHRWRIGSFSPPSAQRGIFLNGLHLVLKVVISYTFIQWALSACTSIVWHQSDPLIIEIGVKSEIVSTFFKSSRHFFFSKYSSYSHWAAFRSLILINSIAQAPIRVHTSSEVINPCTYMPGNKLNISILHCKVEIPLTLALVENLHPSRAQAFHSINKNITKSDLILP